MSGRPGFIPRWWSSILVVIAALLPALAIAQPERPPCQIEGPREARCQAILCALPGNYAYDWFGPGIPPHSALTQCITVTVSGTYAVKVRDLSTGLMSDCAHSIFIDKCTNLPPDCSQARAKDDLLWPPSHEMQTIEIEGVTDPDGDPVLIVVYAVTQDEPLNVEGDGNTCADA